MPISLSLIRQVVCEETGVSRAEFDAPTRRRASPARALAWYLARELTSHSLSEIARYLGGVDHSSVIKGSAAHEKRMERKDTAAFTAHIRARLLSSQGDFLVWRDLSISEFSQLLRGFNKRLEVVDVTDPPYCDLLSYWRSHHTQSFYPERSDP